MCECDRLSLQNLSKIPITSGEELFMRRLVELKARENELKYEVMLLEEKEREMAQMLAVEQALCNCSPPPNYGHANINGNVYTELNNIQKNLRMCVNDMEGPLAQELQLERAKTRRLENQLASIQETIDNSRKTFMAQMQEMKREFKCKCSEMVGVHSLNADLKKQARELECKCKHLENELFQQKLKEAEAVIRLSQTVVTGETENHYCFCSQAGGDPGITSLAKEPKTPRNSKSSQTHEEESQKSPKSKSSSKKLQTSNSLRCSKGDIKSPSPAKGETRSTKSSQTKSPRSSKSETTSVTKSKTKSTRSSRSDIKSPRLSAGGSKRSAKSTDDVTITREIEVKGDLEIDVETEIRLLDNEPADYQMETTCDSGTLEIVTQGPTGMIETTMVYTDSGNIEVITEITEYEIENNTRVQMLPQPPQLLALPCFDDNCEKKKSKISATASRKMSQCDDDACEINGKQRKRRSSNGKNKTNET